MNDNIIGALRILYTHVDRQLNMVLLLGLLQVALLSVLVAKVML